MQGRARALDQEWVPDREWELDQVLVPDRELGLDPELGLGRESGPELEWGLDPEWDLGRESGSVLDPESGQAGRLHRRRDQSCSSGHGRRQGAAAPCSGAPSC